LRQAGDHFRVRPCRRRLGHRPRRGDELLDAGQFILLKIGKLKKKDCDSGTLKAAKDKHLAYWNEKSGELT
jgi:hypothetical protein